MQKILIIDDDPDLCATLTSFLENEKYEVLSCGTAAEATKMIQSNSFSTILVDIFLPDANGIDFISSLQKQGVKTPIVIITGSSELNLARQAIRLGVFDYLVKPFKNVHLQQVIKNSIMHNNLIEEKEMLEKQKRLYEHELEKLVQQKVAELKESELKYQNLLEQSLAGVYIIQDGLFRYTNKKLCEILECDSTEIIDNLGILDFTDPEHYQLVKSNLARRLSGEKTTGSFKFKAKTKQGKKRILEVWAGLVQFQGNQAIEGVVVDITEQHDAKIREQQLELKLMNEHKLAAIGQLAAGISHNLNTPVSIIQGNAELLKLRNPDSEELDKILRQTARLTELINIILTKGKKEQETNVVQININELFQQELEFLNANLFFKHKIEKRYNFADNLPEIKGVYSDFSQSILNIIQNAIDSMYKAPLRELTISTELQKDMIILKIKDTGLGISEENKPKIFDPFFTNKPMQADSASDPNQPTGTGLGLSLVYNLLHPYGVKIEFTSEENKGSEFILKIPLKN